MYIILKKTGFEFTYIGTKFGESIIFPDYHSTAVSA